MRKIVHCAWMIVLWSVGLAGCGEQLTKSEEKFLKLSFGEQQAALLRMDDSTKVQMFEVALEHERPPNLGLAISLAASGGRMVPLIVARAQKTSSRIVFGAYVETLAELEKRGEIAKRETTLIRGLIERVDRMEAGPIAGASRRATARRMRAKSSMRCSRRGLRAVNRKSRTKSLPSSNAGQALDEGC